MRLPQGVDKSQNNEASIGYLAEDYDGIGQYVLVALSRASVSSAFKARVSAGDFGRRVIIPKGTRVVVFSDHGELEVLGLGGPIIAPVVYQEPPEAGETTPPLVINFYDYFSRTSAAGFGTADDGHVWTSNNTLKHTVKNSAPEDGGIMKSGSVFRSTVDLNTGDYFVAWWRVVLNPSGVGWDFAYMDYRIDMQDGDGNTIEFAIENQEGGDSFIYLLLNSSIEAQTNLGPGGIPLNTPVVVLAEFDNGHVKLWIEPTDLPPTFPPADTAAIDHDLGVMDFGNGDISVTVYYFDDTVAGDAWLRDTELYTH